MSVTATTNVDIKHLNLALSDVLLSLKGIDVLYDHQYEFLKTILANQNIFYTNSTNSGKTLPCIIYPELLKKLNAYGYNFPSRPKVLIVTPLNALQLSHINAVKGLGLKSGSLSTKNVLGMMTSDISILFVSPETLKLPQVAKALLTHRENIVLKVVDEVHKCEYFITYFSRKKYFLVKFESFFFTLHFQSLYCSFSFYL